MDVLIVLFLRITVIYSSPSLLEGYQVLLTNL